MIYNLLKMFPNFPDENNYENWEIFNHKKYINANEEKKREIRLNTCLARYEIENDSKFSWLKKYFFSKIKKNELENKIVLDIGCFTGGRLISWAEQYKFKKSYGIDINPIFKIAGEEFSKKKNIDAEFFVAKGEELPFKDNTFDFIVSTDTFEHVQNLEVTMKECFRVLKKDGKLLAVFPQFLQPFESHLNFVSYLPCLHWFFNSKKLSKNYFKILEDRGKDAYWYKPKKNYLEDWEKLPTLNGISIAKFKNIIKKNEWSERIWIRRPILSDGRRSNKIIFKILRYIFYPFIYIKFINELFMGRICVILKK